eukprot:SAG11_NODE_1786_length_4258_cov_1.965617_9_plen_31_part_00
MQILHFRYIKVKYGILYMNLVSEDLQHALE